MKNTKRILRALAGSLLALLMVVAVAACRSSTDPTPPPVGIGSFVGTTWTDNIRPESTIDFISAANVTFAGAYFAPVNQDGQTLTYLEYPDPNEAQVKPAVIVYTDPNKREGFELDYYREDPGTGKPQRLVVWFKGNNLQPREFFKR